MRLIYAALAGFLLGVSAFFTFVVPEVAFSVLGGRGLGSFLAAVFPRFYLVVAVFAAALTAVGFATFGLRHASALAPALALLLTLAAWIWLLPEVNAAIGSPRFGLLHGVSLGLDMLAMVLWLIGLLTARGRRAPASLR